MQIINNSKEYILPDFLIVGAAKSGTTSLFNYLKQHNKIDMCEPKEPYFFSFDSEPDFQSPDKLPGVVWNINEYSSMFKKETSSLKGDASPASLYTYKKTIDKIKSLYGNQAEKIKIIIVLRHPVERMWSMYKHFSKNLKETISFPECVSEDIIKERMHNNWNIFYDYIGFSLYSDAIEAYKNNFNTKIYLFEELKDNTRKIVDDICDFLEIPEMKLDSYKRFNSSGTIRPSILPIYKFLLSKDSRIKRFIASILPKKIRIKTVNLLIKGFRKVFLKKDKLDRKLKKELTEKYFINDIDRLISLLPDKRSYLEEWKRF